MNDKRLIEVALTSHIVMSYCTVVTRSSNRDPARKLARSVVRRGNDRA